MAGSSNKNCPRVIIADPCPKHCALLVQALSRRFGEQAFARTACYQTATDCLSGHPENFDIALIDMNLPDMPDEDFLEKLTKLAEIPVIIITSEEDLEHAVNALEAGAQDYIAKHGNYLLEVPAIISKNIRMFETIKENERLVLKNQWMLSELQEKNTRLEESMQQLQQMVTTDSLTGLMNRRGFSDQLMREFTEAQRYDIDLCCCMIDIDNYKNINDTLGHQMGDETLQIIASEIASSLRSADIAARYGGDEFILLLPHTSQNDAMSVISRVCKNIELGNSQLRVPVTISLGVASLKSDTPADPDGLVAMADRALYRAKQTGKNRVVAFGDIRNE